MSLSIETITIHDEEHILTIVHDITERKRMERALRASEHRYRTFFENLANAVVLLEAVRDEQDQVTDWMIQDANEAALRIVGLSREELRGRPFARLLDPVAMVGRTDIFLEALESGTTKAYEASYRGRLYQGTAFPMNKDTIAITGLDVTEKRRAEQAAQESEERFRNLANSISQLAWMAEPAGGTLLV